MGSSIGEAELWRVKTKSYSAAESLHRLVYTWTSTFGSSPWIHILALITVIGCEALQKPAEPVKKYPLTKAINPVITRSREEEEAEEGKVAPN